MVDDSLVYTCTETRLQHPSPIIGEGEGYPMKLGETWAKRTYDEEVVSVKKLYTQLLQLDRYTIRNQYTWKPKMSKFRC